MPAFFFYTCMTHQIVHGNCLEKLPSIADQSIDGIISDPPYPEISRDYGRLSEQDWHTLMDFVIVQARRVLKPSGSAVFILQPNYKHIGEMRLWLWEFLVRTAKAWNLVQPVYWWRTDAMPNAGCERKNGLCRNSVKYCLWFGPPDCYRSQDAVLWEPSDAVKAESYQRRLLRQKGRINRPSGNGETPASIMQTVLDRGGVTPFNLLPMANGSCNFNGHPAGTPLELAEWWTRYIIPPGGTVLDPFNGAGTMGVAAVKLGRNYIGIEKMAEYVSISNERLQNTIVAA